MVWFDKLLPKKKRKKKTNKNLFTFQACQSTKIIKYNLQIDVIKMFEMFRWWNAKENACKQRAILKLAHVFILKLILVCLILSCHTLSYRTHIFLSFINRLRKHNASFYFLRHYLAHRARIWKKKKNSCARNKNCWRKTSIHKAIHKFTHAIIIVYQLR